MTDKWIEPTAEQAEQAVLVQNEILEAVNRLAREGVDRRVIMAGMGAATADLVTATFGASAVPGWFARQAIMARDAIGR